MQIRAGFLSFPLNISFFAFVHVPCLRWRTSLAAYNVASDSIFFSDVKLNAGEMIFAMASNDGAPSVPSELLLYWAKLKQHLTELTLRGCPRKGKVQDLEAVGMLKALRKLDVISHVPYKWDPQLDLSGETLTLELPHLVNLRWTFLGHGNLVLSCPKLAGAYFDKCESLHILMEDAALTDIMLYGCRETQVEAKSAEDHFPKLEYLTVVRCKEAGKHLIEYVGQMRRLKNLSYGYFPAACMPKSFPQSLEDITLCALDWRHDLPEGLTELPRLRSFYFTTSSKSWKIARPLAELLPLRGLDNLQLAGRCYEPEDHMGSDANVLGRMPRYWKE